MLRLNREFECIFLTDLIALPEALEQVKAEFTTQSFLNNLAIALPTARGPHLHSSQYLLVDRQCRAHPRHQRILASICVVL